MTDELINNQTKDHAMIQFTLYNTKFNFINCYLDCDKADSRLKQVAEILKKA